MKIFNVKLLGPLRFYLILFAACFLSGVLFTDICWKWLSPSIMEIQTTFTENLKIYRLNQSVLFQSALLRTLKYTGLILLFSLSNINMLFLVYLFCSKGITHGIILASYVLHSGLSGCISYVGMLFPHYLFYIPAYLFFIGYALDFSGQSQDNSLHEKGQSLLRGLPTFLLLFLLLLVGNLLEAYVNVRILKYLYP